MIAVEVRVQNSKHFFTEALEHLRIAHEFANNVQGMDALEDVAAGFVRELNDYRQVIKAHRDLMEGGTARETIRAAAKETRRIEPPSVSVKGSPHAESTLGVSLSLIEASFRNIQIDYIGPDFEKRLRRLGERITSFDWWMETHPTLGCSPRDAVDCGRLEEVEALFADPISAPAEIPSDPSTAVCPLDAGPATSPVTDPLFKSIHQETA